MKLSVVIPALDEEGEVADAVASAAAEGVEVLVVDGGSRDGTPGRAREAGAAVLHSAPGRARQLGVGAVGTRGDVVIFLHADTRLPPGWDAEVRRACGDPRVAGGSFRFRFRRDEDAGAVWSRGGLALRIVEWGARLRGVLLGLPYGDQALFVRRSVLEAMGGVPQVPIMEDLDLVRAMKRRGRVVRLAPAATTSARRYLARGIRRTVWRNTLAVCGWLLGFERDRIAEWYGR